MCHLFSRKEHVYILGFDCLSKKACKLSVELETNYAQAEM